MIRENIQRILEAHTDKTPEILAAMIVGYLAAGDIISVGNGAVEDDPRYTSDNEEEPDEGEEENDKLSEDYKSIGIKLCRLGRSYY